MHEHPNLQHPVLLVRELHVDCITGGNNYLVRRSKIIFWNV